VADLREYLGAQAILLDGDEVRSALGEFAYDSKSRLRLALSYQAIAKMLSGQGFVVVVATVSLFHEVHDSNRRIFPNYLEVFLDLPLETLAEGVRSQVYRAQTDVDPSQTAEYPRSPDLHFVLGRDGRRDNWLPKLRDAVGGLLK
jgi:adenylylsulfate kinase-like enzyme